MVCATLRACLLPSRILQVRETIAIVALITATSIIILYFCRALGNDLRLKKSRVKYDLQKFFFSNGVVNTWNSFPNSVLSDNTTNMFKTRLDKFWHNQDVTYNYSCREPEVLSSFRTKNVSKELYHKVVRWGGHRGLGLRS